MIRLTAKECQIIMEALGEKYGDGYSQEPEVGRLQAKLSIMAEAAMRAEQMKGGDNAEQGS